MLFNNQTEIDDIFKNPGSEYRSAPFWALNGKLKPEILKKQIRDFKQMGFGGFYMHPRTGFDTEYLSGEFMECIKACLSEAKENGLLAWLYDEDRYPSGSAGGYTTKDPSLRSVFMLATPKIRGEAVSKLYGIAEHKTYLLGIYDVCLNDDNELVSYKIASEDDPVQGERYYIYCVPEKPSPMYGGRPYANILSREAGKKFVDVTHEKYKEKVGDEFGKTIRGIFTDEPFGLTPTWYYHSWPFNGNTETDFGIFWTHDFPQQFLSDYGINILDCLPEVLWSLENGENHIKHKFMSMVAKRFTEAYIEQISNWCEENDIALVGHLVREEDLIHMTSSSGEIMLPLSKFQIPGVDLLRNGIELTTLKQCQSVKNQYGREAMLTELYGISNWDFDFRSYKYQGDWQVALGVTHRVEHLAMYTMEGEAKRDYPAAIDAHSPWHKDYLYLQDHFARLSAVLSRGKALVKVAVIHPVESYYMNIGPSEKARLRRERIDGNFKNITSWLLEGHIDFDFLSESLMPELWHDGAFGEMKYDTVILPSLETIRDTTLGILKEFISRGGRVIIAGQVPYMINAEFSDEIQTLLPKCEMISNEKESILEVLENDRQVRISRGGRALIPKGVLADEYIYTLREDCAFKWLFIAKKDKMPCPDFDTEKSITISVKGEYTPKLYDTCTGKIKYLPFTIKKGYTYITHKLYSVDSLLIRLSEKTALEGALEEKSYESKKTIDFKNKVEYVRHEPNVLVIDRAEYSVDGGKLCPEEEFLKIGKKVYSDLGWGEPGMLYIQPWLIDDHEKHQITLKTSFESMVETEAYIAMEKAEIAEILLNGEKVSTFICGEFVDHSIKKRKIKVKQGNNQLVITYVFTKKYYPEWIYILGDFNVEVLGCRSIITPKSNEIAFSSVTGQGMPFYGGNITYKTKISTPDCKIRINCTYFRGAAVRVYIDGKKHDLLAIPPYSMIADVDEGEHIIEFELLGNRYNTFGDFHNVDSTNPWCTPSSWRTEGAEFCYEYRLRDMGIMKSPVIEILDK